MTITDTGAALLGSPVRRHLVDTLVRAEAEAAGSDDGARTANALAEIVELHVTTVRFHLDQLVAAGLLDSSFRKGHGVGRPRKVYAVRAGSLDEPRRSEALRILTELLAESFSGTAPDGRPLTPAEVGEKWAHDHIAPETEGGPADSPGRWLAKVGRMIDVLQDWGYTPELTTTRGGRTARIELADCPFLDLARTNPAVVCGIHRGLIAGTLEQFGEPGAEVSLEPFVGPRLCLAHVSTHTPFTRPSPASKEQP